MGWGGRLLVVLVTCGGAVGGRGGPGRAGGDVLVGRVWLVWGALSSPVALLGAWTSHIVLRDSALVTDLALSFAAVGLPLTIGIAVLRHRLFDIQLVLSRTLTYAVLTVVVVGVSVGLLWATDWLFGEGRVGGAAGAGGVGGVRVMPVGAIDRLLAAGIDLK